MSKMLVLVKDVKAKEEARKSLENFNEISDLELEIEIVPRTIDNQDIVVISPYGRYCGVQGIEKVKNIIRFESKLATF